MEIRRNQKPEDTLSTENQFPHKPDDDMLFLWKLDALFFEEAWKRSGFEKIHDVPTALKEVLDLSRSGRSSDDVALLHLSDRIAGATHRFRVGTDKFSKPCFIHPLSGKVYKLSVPKEKAWKIPDWASLRGKTPREQYFYAWRHLVEDLQRENTDVPVQFVAADAVAPHFPLWNHLHVTSAVYSCLKRGGIPGFLSFNLGSPQAFVQASRKLSDLWAGSFILSFLTMAVIKELCSQWGPDMFVFPSLYGQPWIDFYLVNKELAWKPPIDCPAQKKLIPTFPNQFMMIFPANSADPLKLKEVIETSIKDKWEEMAQSALGYLENKGSAVFAEKQKHEQLSARPHFEFIYYPWGGVFEKGTNTAWKTWAANALEGEKELHTQLLGGIEPVKKYLREAQTWHTDGDDSMLVGDAYALIYKKTSTFLSARRTERDFSPIPGYLLPNDSLSGELNQLSTEACLKTPDMGAHRHLWQALSTKMGAELGPQEGLSLPGVIKRFLRTYVTKELAIDDANISFPSVAGVASAVYRQKLLELASKDAEVKRAAANYMTKLKVALEGYERLSESEDAISVAGLSNAVSALKISEPEFIRLCTMEGNYLSFDGLNGLGKALTEVKGASKTGALDETREALKSLRRAVTAALKDMEKPDKEYFSDLLKDPPTYYAIIMMDGDHMGEWLSGRKHAQEPRLYLSHMLSNPNGKDGNKYEGIPTPLNLSIHQTVSAALQSFAHRVYAIVETRNMGKVVYAGGDDVLALVPAANALACARELRLKYSGYPLPAGDSVGGLGGALPLAHTDWTSVEDVSDEPPEFLSMGRIATSSCGIAIAHINSSLQRALAVARESEQEAKNLIGRNAWVLAVQKRSGEFVKTGLPWWLITLVTSGYPGKTIDTSALMYRLQAARGEGISSAFFYEAAETALRLGNINETFLNNTALPPSWDIREIITRELIRLWERHGGKRGKDGITFAGQNTEEPFGSLYGLINYFDSCHKEWREYDKDLKNDQNKQPPAAPNYSIGIELSNIFRAVAFSYHTGEQL